MKKTFLVALAILQLILFVYAGGVIADRMGATNFDRIVLGEGNFGTDPNTTADITGQNDEYLTNYTDGSWDIGSANFLLSGDLLGADSIKARTIKLTEGLVLVDLTMTGDLLGVDSLKARTITTSGLITVGAGFDVATGWAGNDTIPASVDSDTLTVTGVAATDFVVVSMINFANADSTWIASELATNKIIVHRKTIGTVKGALPYHWIRVK